MFSPKLAQPVSSMNIFFAMVLVFCVQLNLAEKETEFRVENGTAAKLTQFPYQVAIKKAGSVRVKFGRKSRGWQHTYCGGTIIGTSKVLTAAHCFFSRRRKFLDMCCGQPQSLTIPLRKIFVVGGNLRNAAKYRSDNPDGKEQWRRPRKVIPHPQYKFPSHDIAVLFVGIPFILTKYVNVIPYAENYKDYTGLRCVVSGFGRMKHGKSDVLLWAHVNVISHELCSLMVAENMRNFVCISTMLSGVGKGDSGGPLVCYNTGHENELKDGDGILVGVTCGKGKFISVFTRVSAYRSLIDISRAATIESNFILCISTLYLITNCCQVYFVEFLCQSDVPDNKK